MRQLGSLGPKSGFLGSIIDVARTKPERPAIVHRSSNLEKVLTFDDVVTTTFNIASLLSRQVNGGSGKVIIVSNHQFLQYPCYLAVMAAGLIPSFLAYPTSKQDPDHYWLSQGEIFRHLRPEIVIGYHDIADRLRPLANSVGARLLLIEALCLTDPACEPWRTGPVDPDQLLLIQHSSGTTGARKGVALTHRQAMVQAAAYAGAVRLDGESTVVSWLPPYHDMGLFSGFLLPLSVGATVVSIDPFEWVARPALLFEALEAHHGTHCWLPNFAFAHLIKAIPEDDRFDLSSLVALVSCSETVKARTLETFAARFADSGVRADQICACYAMAEAAFAVTQTAFGSGWSTRWYDADLLDQSARAVQSSPGAPGARPLVSNGTPIAAIEVRILARPTVAEPGEGGAGLPVGEIAIRGDCVFNGYLENASATRAAFDQDWFRTGDLGFLDGEELFITGRAKDVIIVHGRNYYAHDIEFVVSAVDGVIPGRVAAIGLDDEEASGEEAIVIVETAPVAVQDANEIKRRVKRAVFDALGLTLQSVNLVPRGWLVKTTSGKISRTANLERLRSPSKAQIAS